MLIPLFSENVEVESEASFSRVYGIAGVYRFWQDLAFSFQRSNTLFSNIFYGPAHAVLEWQSNVTLPTGERTHLNGVTLLVLEGEKIIRLSHHSNRLALIQGIGRTSAA